MDKNGSVSYSHIKELRINNYELRISPNPAKDFVIVSGWDFKQVIISDISGRVQLKSTANKIDISSLVSGTYMVQIETLNGNHVTEKLVKLP